MNIIQIKNIVDMLKKKLKCNFNMLLLVGSRYDMIIIIMCNDYLTNDNDYTNKNVSNLKCMNIEQFLF